MGCNAWVRIKRLWDGSRVSSPQVKGSMCMDRGKLWAFHSKVRRQRVISIYSYEYHMGPMGFKRHSQRRSSM
jgi:hypothetical protein